MDEIPESPEVVIETLLREFQTSEFRVDELPGELTRNLFILMVELCAKLAVINSVDDPERRVRQVKSSFNETLYKVRMALHEHS